MSDQFQIAGPASISFSGGRTSAYMLWRIVQAHGGALPDDVVVTFANTGKEREETLRFVHECGSRWGVRIHWVEWRPGKPGFEEVGFNSASRRGEPFAALIASKKRLPNWQERWCTGYLKVKAMHAFNASLGRELGSFAEVIGLRDDEGPRILTGEAAAKKSGRRVAYPLADAGITKPDVMAFWRRQPFDLQLKPHEGNCDLCFLKGRGLRKRIIRDNPDVADWWLEQERLTAGFFDRRDRVAELVAEVHRNPELQFVEEAAEYDTECGDSCGGDSPWELDFLQREYERRKAVTA